ncbi:MAG: hypothetical protein AAFO79_12695, partial [Pseudomonadota bacterium]
MYEGAEYRGRSRTTVWDGGLVVTDNRVAGAHILNNWNLDRGIHTVTETDVRWKAVTTGNIGAIDLRLAEKNSGQIVVCTKHATAELAIADVGLEPVVIDAGGLDRRLSLYRLPDVLANRQLTHTMTVPLRADGDTRLYVRVTHEDGHRAWSSPIYLNRSSLMVHSLFRGHRVSPATRRGSS